MAAFVGTGNLTLFGGDAKLYDCLVACGGLTVTGDDVEIAHNKINTGITLDSGVDDLDLHDNEISVFGEPAITFSGANDRPRIHDNHIDHFEAAE